MMVEVVARNFLIPDFTSAQEFMAFLVQSAHFLAVSKYMTFAFFTLLIYDHMLTLPEEIKIVWLGRPSLVKVLFVFNRYLVIIFVAIDIATFSGGFHLTDKFCRTWLNTDEVFEFLSLISSTLIISFRVHAVVGGMIRGMLPVLLGIWGGQAIISAVLVIVQMIVKGSRTIAAETNFGVCLADVQSGKWWVVWIPSMAFHTLVFGLLIWKSISTPREAQTLMLTLLIRDGIVYFVVVFAAFLFNLLVFAVAPVTLAIMPHDSVWCITTMALSRLMLSMDNISSTMKSEGDEENELVATHTPSGLAETVYLDSWREPSPSKEQSRRSWSHSTEEGGQPIPRRVQSPLGSNPSENAVRYPGAISGRHENDPRLRSSLRPTFSIPFVYVRPLPLLPRPTVILTSYEQISSSEISRAHLNSPTTSPRPQSRLRAHRSATSQLADAMKFDLSQYQTDRMTSESPQEARIRPARPSISSFGPSDSQLLTDNAWQGMVSYPRAL